MATAAQHRAARPRPVPELLIGLAVFAVYLVVQGLAGTGRTAAAERNARALFGLEQDLHLDLERPLNRWLAGHEHLAVFANYEYAYTYVLSAFLLLGWVWLRRPDIYRWARTSFVWLNLLGIACFAAYPLMPPRLLPGEGFVDTVTRGGTVGSWGSSLVSHANQLAAMPSLHVAWALWVSVVLALVHGGWRSQLASALHVALTVWVVLATANHYLLDAVGGIVVVTLGLWLAGRRRPGRPARPVRVPAADSFFLHVETPEAPQHVGGVVLLDTSESPDGAPTLEEVRARVRKQLPVLPRFTQRLTPPSRWRRPRWEPVEELDWDYHVPLVDLSTPDGRPGGMAAFDALIARISGTPLRRDRPLWQFQVVHGIEVDRAAVLLIVHHVVADGIGTVQQALRILEPPQPAVDAPRSAPGPLAVVAGTIAGLAQLATDGGARGRFPVQGTNARSFTTLVLSLAEVQAVARGVGVRVSDVLLTAVAGGLTRVLGERTDLPARLRTAVPLMVRDAGAEAEANRTAAVMVDLPLGPRDERDRLAEVVRRTGRLRSGSRALASRFVMQDVGELMPLPVHRWFSRTVYGRRFFHAIVSNMPGPDAQIYVTGVRIQWAGPLLPLAAGTPLAIGALSWNGDLLLGITADPLLVPDARELAARIAAVVDELGQVQPSTSSSSRRTSGSSSSVPKSSRSRASR